MVDSSFSDRLASLHGPENTIVSIRISSRQCSKLTYH